MSGVSKEKTSRSGPATSCAECKRRKIRCRWPRETDSRTADQTGVKCANCVARGKTCRPQQTSIDSVDTNHATARDRITALELQVADLNAFVKGSPSRNAAHSDEENIEVALPVDASRSLWYTICAVERFTSIMLNPSTDKSGRTIPSDVSITRNGRIDIPTYIYQLSDILLRIHKVKEMITDANMWIYYEEVVQNIDRDLTTLSTQIPKTWWSDYETLSEPEKLAQFWHCYLLALLHLQTALSDDSNNRFANNRENFHSASKGAVVRYLNLRTSSSTELPMPFSLDVQAFAVTAFLLLNSHAPRGEQELDEDLKTLYFVHRVVESFKSNRTRSGSESARKAAETLISLHEFFACEENEQFSIGTLDIPLVGSVTFMRADGLLGVGDAGLTSLPWSFTIDLAGPWPQEVGFHQRAPTDET